MSTPPSSSYRSVKRTRIYLQYIGLIAVFLSTSNSVNAAVGAIAGESSVSPGGASSYSIPIQVSPGIGGLTPEIALQYSSQSGNGPAGVGWGIGGLSTIHRCPQTLEQDGQYKGVQLNAEDRLCLDGKRLIPVYGNYASSSAEYRTGTNGVRLD